MNRIAIFAAALLLATRGSQQAFGLGGEHPRQSLESQGASCVHGYFINESDVFYHTGDAGDFNKFAAELVKRHGRKVQIVVHAGVGQAKSPWDKTNRGTPADWSVTTGPAARRFGERLDSRLVRIDLWLHGRVKQADVKFPADAEVVSITACRADD
ncbi:MAG: hypothetical protein NT069_07880 [Planctomycetota bacterium]|nr:hypothetical protein [Planctomycetota bacterium]